MKKDLLELIEQIPHIYTLFRHFEPHKGLIVPSGDYIYDNAEFIMWKQTIIFELQSIYDETHDTYVFNLINPIGVIKKFDGKHYDERKMFDELASSLNVIKKNIDKYYPAEAGMKKEEAIVKKPKVFISHSSNDVKYIIPFVEFLADLGLSDKTMFCSSIPDYSIPLGEDIYNYLKSQFNEYNLHVIYLLSKNYYQSPACLNEMGASWVLQNTYITVLLPDFDFPDIKGAISPRQIGLKYKESQEMLKTHLCDLKKQLLELFSLSIPDNRWEVKRDSFIKAISDIDK